MFLLMSKCVKQNKFFQFFNKTYSFNCLKLFCLLQGDPGGLIGIVPMKGEKGYPGTPGRPVRSACVCEHAVMCLYMLKKVVTA